MVKYKRKLHGFTKEIIITKLIEFGEVTLEKLIGTIMNFGKFSADMISPDSYRRLRTSGNYSSEYPSIDSQTKRAFYSLIYKLKKDNLISRTAAGNLRATKAGVVYLENKIRNISWSKHYQTEVNPNKSEVILIIFDIPETKRIRRDWLRFQLANLGFRRLQLSVWWSNNILPQEFINDLERFKILNHVHILSVNKKGSLSNFLFNIGERGLSK